MRILTLTGLLLIVLLTCSCSHLLFWRHPAAPATAAPAKPTPVGQTWRGAGRVTVAWSQAAHLPVALTFAEHGAVTGTLGDASLTNGKWQHVTGQYSGAREGRDVYVVEGQLIGPLVASEGITRACVRLRLEFTGKLLVGELATCGQDTGPVNAAPFTVIGLKLLPPANTLAAAAPSTATVLPAAAPTTAKAVPAK